MISPTHVLTAYHVAEQCARVGSLGCSVALDGAFAATPVFLDQDRDLCVMKLGQRVAEAHTPGQPQAFPNLRETPVGHGSSVGFVAQLHAEGRTGEGDRTYMAFFPAHVSFFLRGKAPFWVLSSGCVEPGCSGGPVFDPTGDIVGVMIQRMTFMSGNVPMLFPIMSPIIKVRHQILEAMKR